MINPKAAIRLGDLRKTLEVKNIGSLSHSSNSGMWAVTYLAERAKLFGLVKAERKRHREKATLHQQIWASIALS